jgi:C1A family cysteine protease
MFGQNFAQTVQELKKYVIKYGAKPLSPYFTAIHWEQATNGDVSLSKVELTTGHTDEFISDLNNLYSVELVKKTFPSADKEHEIVNYFDNLCASTITSGNVGDYKDLHFCLYIPLYEPEFWEQAKALIGWIKSLNRHTHIDVVGFASDLANVIHSEDETNAQQKKTRELQTKTTIQEIVKHRNENSGDIYHFLVMQNTQSGGISLNLNNDSFVRVLGEFAMMCVENYRLVFGVATPQSDLQSFGVSTLHFDKYYFIEYLLHKAYIFAMEREGVQENEVDINFSYNKSKEILKDRIHLLSDFFKKEVLPRIGKDDENYIVAGVTPLLDAKLKEIDTDCDTIINDKNLSIPAKRAILSALLGYDDDLFANTLFDDNTLIFDDLDTEAMNEFIEANNKLLEFYDEDTKEFPFADKAVLSQDRKQDEKTIIHPLNAMKKLHTEIRRRIGYVRNLEQEKKKLESQIENISESKKCLVDGEFYVFGDRKYRLLPEIEEIPLQDDYVPHSVRAASVDLRKDFSNIRNQGQQGSCTAYALTSIYEYILKSNKAEKADLSEAFLYYNSRKKAGDKDKDDGSSYHYAFESLVESGICEEFLMPYCDKDFTTEPTQEAYDDALQRRVKKAVNVNRNIEDLKSALEDGYPIAISAILCDSFGKGHKGIISLPTEEELEKAQKEGSKHYRHAMVICGYNNDDKLFIVRNSWGTEFGDNGYCYIPYSYIVNEDLVRFAAIITEIETTENYSVKKGEKKSTWNVDKTDANVRFEIAKNSLAEQQLLLRKNKKDYELLRLSYELLKQKLKDPNNHDKLRNSTKERIETEVRMLGILRKKTREEKYKRLNEFRKRTWKTGINIVSIATIIATGLFLLLGTILAAVAILVFLYFPYRRRKLKKLEREFDDKLERLAKQIGEKKVELEQTSLKMHFAGDFLRKLFELHSAVTAKHSAAASFGANLKIWYFQERETIKQLNPDTQMPFIPLLKNDKLDDYFETHKTTITENISLSAGIVDFSKTIENDTISKEDLKQYKENIKENCVKELEDLLQNFNVYSYLCNPNVRRFEFLDKNPQYVEEILPKLDEKSHVFLCDNGAHPIVPGKFIFINAPTDDDKKQWERFYPRFFSVIPNSVSFSSPYKVMVVQLAELNVSQID